MALFSTSMGRHANFWQVTRDAAGAASFGFQVVWINRFGQHRERLPGGPDAESAILDQLIGLLG